MTTLTTEQTKSLVDEFINFVINDWTPEQMQSYVYDSLKQEILCTRNHLPLQESLKLQVDEYDDNLYDILVPYVKDEEGSWEVMQEYIHDRNAMEWIDD